MMRAPLRMGSGAVDLADSTISGELRANMLESFALPRMVLTERHHL
jgi:hypothetical protein